MRLYLFAAALSCGLVACATPEDVQTKREAQRLNDAAEAVSDDPLVTIGETTAIIQSEAASNEAKATAHRLRATAESRREEPDWDEVRDDLEAALALSEPLSDAHRLVTVDLVNLASARGDDDQAVALLTSPDLARTPTTDARLAALIATEAARGDGRRPNSDSEINPSPNEDARPLVRVAPSGYERCMGKALPARVTLEFDVDERGIPDDVEVTATTDPCFDRYAVRAVERWRYAPALQDGVPVRRLGVRTTLTFDES